MADEHNTALDNVDNKDTKVEFSTEQQAKVQELIDAAVGRVATKVRNEESAKLTTLQSELDAAKAASKAAKTPTQKQDAAEDVAALRSQIEEMKIASKSISDEATRWKGEAQKKADEAKSARDEAQRVHMEVAMQNAASKIPFVDTEVVIALTKGQVHRDAEGKFIVLREDGQPRLNASMEPMSLEEFYNDFAGKRPYLVRGDVKSGTSASENTKSAFTGNRQIDVATIFGPKSDSRLANELAKNNYAEYKRLKVIAKGMNLVA